MMYVNQLSVDAVANEMGANIDMFHASVTMWIVGAGHGALIVAV
jgi:hypothetical protein